ncbi:hypothetical protein [Streptomyces sp. NPDC051776]|uniref:hypothetical protein n=1 Tax=Streptomyces sp. NPDC051776 TaxID=3155414 RepID=UPI00343742C8
MAAAMSVAVHRARQPFLDGVIETEPPSASSWSTTVSTTVSVMEPRRQWSYGERSRPVRMSSIDTERMAAARTH